MNETDYHRLADRALNTLYDVLDEADENGTLEVEYQDGILTISLAASPKQYVVSKHSVSQEIWLSSPMSGGLHFSYRDSEWALADGRTLSNVLFDELEMLTGETIA